MADFKGVYQRYIQMKMVAEAASDFQMLDPVEKRILNLLSVYWENQQAITVVEAINMTDEFSTSTAFRYLKKLRLKGYIELLVDELDNRVKYVSPSKLTDKYFAKLGRLMVQATRLET